MMRVNKVFPIIHLIGSTKIENEQQFLAAEKYYTKNGYIVFKPVFFGLDENDENIEMYTDMCTQKLNMCDAVCVVTEHIGESTRKRIRQATALNKRIMYFSEVMK